MSMQYHVWIVKSVKIRADCTDELNDATLIVMRDIEPLIKQLNSPELL